MTTLKVNNENVYTSIDFIYFMLINFASNK